MYCRNWFEFIYIDDLKVMPKYFHLRFTLMYAFFLELKDVLITALFILFMLSECLFWFIFSIR